MIKIQTVEVDEMDKLEASLDKRIESIERYGGEVKSVSHSSYISRWGIKSYSAVIVYES